MNTNNNNNNHEIIFWKVFRNIYIRNYILSKIINNNNNQSKYSYNGTTSLKLMINNNKLPMILDKLKSNHYIHIDCIPNLSDYINLSDPYYKIISKEICKLLWLKYGSYIFVINHSFIKKSDSFSPELSKLWYYNINNNNNNDNNNFNYYMAHSLLYKLLKKDDDIFKNSQIIKLLNQLINNNENFHINKKQKINNNIPKNNKNQDFIQKLLLTSKSVLSESSSLSKVLSLHDEIIEAIYNNKPIPLHLNHYYMIHISIYNYRWHQELYENELKLDIRSVILNSDHIHDEFSGVYNKELSELMVLKLLYHHVTISDAYKDYSIGCIESAKIYCLNIISTKDYYESNTIYKEFKQYLINNQVNTLNELISVADNILGGGIEEYKAEDYFGPYYNYHLITSNQIERLSINSNQNKELLLHYSILTQNVELFDKYINSIDPKSRITLLGGFALIRKSVGNSFSGENNINGDNNNQSIKDKSTIYFNHIFKEIDKIYHKKDLMVEIFKIIINSYNSKLYEWLLESNKELKDMFHKLIDDGNYFGQLYLDHSTADYYSDQVDYEMLDVFINQIKTKDLNDTYFGKDIGFEDNIITEKMFQKKVYILNHLIKSPRSSRNGYSFIELLTYDILIYGFRTLKNVDTVIRLYNQIDQKLLLIYYNSFNNENNNLINIYLSAYENKSIVLVTILIHSIIHLDFNSVIKIISATLNNTNNINNRDNNNIYIPPTFNNSLDLIKYLISNQYLKEFNLYHLLEEIILNIQVDKEFIMELISLSNNEIKNTTKTTTKTDSLIIEIDEMYKDKNKNNKKQLLLETKRNQIFSLETLERIKYEDENTRNYQFLDGTLLKKCIGIHSAIKKYYFHGYFIAIYQFLNNNKELDISSIEFDNKSYPISIEWYSKLYPVLFKKILKSNYLITDHCSYNPPEIFEFIWNNHFPSNIERKNYILDLLFSTIHNNNSQLVEYILKTKREFIISFVIEELDYNQKFKIHEIALFNYNIQIFHQIRLIFSSFKFEINYNILGRLLYQCDKIKYLYENNLIPNLEEIIGIERLNKFRIEEYYNFRTFDNYNRFISKSMFILIHTIIKLQKQQ